MSLIASMIVVQPYLHKVKIDYSGVPWYAAYPWEAVVGLYEGIKVAREEQAEVNICKAMAAACTIFAELLPDSIRIGAVQSA